MGRRPAAQAHSFSVALSCRENGPIKHDKGGKGLGKEGTGAVRLLTVPGELGLGTPEAGLMTSDAQTGLRKGTEGCSWSWDYPRRTPKTNMPTSLCSCPVCAFPFPSSLCFPGSRQQPFVFACQWRLEILQRWRVERSPRPWPDGTLADIKSKYHQ